MSTSRATALNGDNTWQEISGRRRQLEIEAASPRFSRAYVGNFGFQGRRPAERSGSCQAARAQPRSPAKMQRPVPSFCCSTNRPTTSTSIRYSIGRRPRQFAGCAVISHDRWFLDRIAFHILASRRAAYGMVQATTRGLQGRPASAPRHRSRPAAPDQVKAVGALAKRVAATKVREGPARAQNCEMLTLGAGGSPGTSANDADGPRH